MAGSTQRVIRKTFMALLEERPLNEITVKLIVERCGINRKTFYNHYRDIPDLMEKILTDEVDAIVARYTQVDSIEECLGHAIEFALQHKRAALHIYRSVGRDVYVESTLKLCDYLVRTYLAKVDGAAEMDAEIRAIIDEAYEKCREILARYKTELTAVAEYLLEHETMDGDTFKTYFTQSGESRQ